MRAVGCTLVGIVVTPAVLVALYWHGITMYHTLDDCGVGFCCRAFTSDLMLCLWIASMAGLLFVHSSNSHSVAFL